MAAEVLGTSPDHTLAAQVPVSEQCSTINRKFTWWSWLKTCRVLLQLQHLQTVIIC